MNTTPTLPESAGVCGQSNDSTDNLWTDIPDLINLIEWNEFAEQRMTLLEALTTINNRHRDTVADFNQRLIDRTTGFMATLQAQSLEISNLRSVMKEALEVLMQVSECRIFCSDSMDIDDNIVSEALEKILKIQRLVK